MMITMDFLMKTRPLKLQSQIPYFPIPMAMAFVMVQLMSQFAALISVLAAPMHFQMTLRLLLIPMVTASLMSCMESLLLD